jgi:hypothetical protein
MTWFDRLFGPYSGPVYGRGDEPLERAKEDLLARLRERGAKSASIVYDGGHDEGFINELRYSDEPLAGDEDGWTALRGGSSLDIDSAFESPDTPDGKLLEAAEYVMCDKWGSFAGEFEVQGQLLVDVETGRIVRRDAISVEDGPVNDQVEII